MKNWQRKTEYLVRYIDFKGAEHTMCQENVEQAYFHYKELVGKCKLVELKEENDKGCVILRNWRLE